MTISVFVLAAMSLITPIHAADASTAIEHLLAAVEQSDATFLRNGDAHTGEEAAAHMRKKYNHFKKDIQTPEDFIRLAGTKSLLSGKPYEVRLPDGREVPTSSWLSAILREYREDTSS